MAAGRLDWAFLYEDVVTAVDADPLMPESSSGPRVENSPVGHDESDGYLIVRLRAPGEAIDRGDGQPRP